MFSRKVFCIPFISTLLFLSACAPRDIQIPISPPSPPKCAKADVVIRPRVGHIGASDFSKRHEAILEGEKAALEVLPKIKEILDRFPKDGRG